MIGAGGQGEVRAATQLSTGKKVAVKFLFGGQGAQQRGRFQREVRILATLDHPGIVRVVDAGENDAGTLYMATEFVDGEPMDQYVAKLRRRVTEGATARRADPVGLQPEAGVDAVTLSNQAPASAAASRADALAGAESATLSAETMHQLLHLFVEILDAVNVAHRYGIVHRDLKPSNVVIDRDGKPRVLDFGLARAGLPEGVDGAARGLTVTGVFMGSLPWAAPEQAEGAPSKIDVRTDVYALGVMLYELCTGQFPYEVVGGVHDVLNRIVHDQPLPPSTVFARLERCRRRRRQRWLGSRRQHVNRLLDAIVLKALSKRREDRYQNAGEFAVDLRDYLAGREPRLAGDAPAWTPKRELKGRLRRGVSVSATIGVAALLAVALVWGGSTLYRQYAGLPLVRAAERAELRARLEDQRQLAIAAATNDVPRVRELLAIGASPEARDDSGVPAAHLAMRAGFERVLDLLLEAGLEPDLQDDDSRSLLQLAVEQGDHLMIRRLLDAGADPDLRLTDGLTALLVAIHAPGGADAASLLLNAGADPNRADREGRTPLHHAVVRGDGAMIDLLVEAGAAFERYDRNGYVPLHFAVNRGDLDMVKQLVEAGAPLGTPCETWTAAAIDMARVVREPATIAWLEERNAPSAAINGWHIYRPHVRIDLLKDRIRLNLKPGQEQLEMLAPVAAQRPEWIELEVRGSRAGVIHLTLEGDYTRPSTGEGGGVVNGLGGGVSRSVAIPRPRQWRTIRVSAPQPEGPVVLVLRASRLDGPGELEIRRIGIGRDQADPAGSPAVQVWRFGSDHDATPASAPSPAREPVEADEADEAERE